MSQIQICLQSQTIIMWMTEMPQGGTNKVSLERSLLSSRNWEEKYNRGVIGLILEE